MKPVKACPDSYFEVNKWSGRLFLILSSVSKTRMKPICLPTKFSRIYWFDGFYSDVTSYQRRFSFEDFI